MYLNSVLSCGFQFIKAEILTLYSGSISAEHVAPEKFLEFVEQFELIGNQNVVG